jgi:hypothetical protein
MGLFGASRKESWESFAKEMNGEVIKLGKLKGDGVLVPYKTFEILLDTYTVSTGNAAITYTRLRTTFINPRAIDFKIYHKSFFSQFGKMLGMQDIEIGDMAFDHDFIIKGNATGEIVKLFNRSRIKQHILAEPKLTLQIKHKNEWLQKPLKENESIIEYQSVGVIKDNPRLINLCELFKDILDALVEDEIANPEKSTTSLYD